MVSLGSLLGTEWIGSAIRGRCRFALVGHSVGGQKANVTEVFRAHPAQLRLGQLIDVEMVYTAAGATIARLLLVQVRSAVPHAPPLGTGQLFDPRGC